MLRAYGIRATGIMSVLLLVGCGSTTVLSFGAENEALVQAVLDTPDRGDAALAAGEATYLIPKLRLREEGDDVIRALRTGPYLPRRNTWQDMEASLPIPEQPIVSLMNVHVLEFSYPDAVLHVRRMKWSSSGRPYYRICVVRGNELICGGSKQGDPIDVAWNRLAAAARKQSGTVIYQYDGHPRRPLDEMYAAAEED